MGGAILVALLLAALVALVPVPHAGAQASVPDLTGTWKSSLTTDLYVITQNGAQVSWVRQGTAETAKGSLQGTQLSVSWSGGPVGAGSATATVVVGADGQPSEIRFTNNAVFTRVAGASTGALGPTLGADKVCLTGDIDNLNFGWPSGFDPFSGNSTPAHGYPWTVNASDAAGTDRIMVGTSAKGAADGYARSTSRPGNSPQAVPLACDASGVSVQSVMMQLFVDDFQAPLWKSSFTATLNGKAWPGLATVLNSLTQTGPIGKLITVQVPQSLFADALSGRLLIDDATTGVGDGYAIDFVRVLVNPKQTAAYSGTVQGRVVDARTKAALAGATVSAALVRTTTGSDGRYTLSGVTAGLATLTASAAGHKSKTASTDLVAGKTATLDFELEEGVDETTTTGVAAPTTTRAGATTAPATTAPVSTLPGTGTGRVLPTPPIGSGDPPPGITGFTIVAGQRTVREGGLVWVPVTLVNAVDVANMNYRITYDPTIAKVEGSVRLGPFPNGALFEVNANQSGRVLVGFAWERGGTGTQVTAYLPFRAVGKAGQRTALTVEVTKADNTGGRALNPNRMHGAVIITGPNDVFPGDCDNDNRLTAWDARCALQMSVELRTVDMKFDMDNDRQVTSRDATVILQRRTGTLAGV